jgi:hypothetical protein
MVVKDPPSKLAKKTTPSRADPRCPGYSEHEWKVILDNRVINWCLNCGKEEVASTAQLRRMREHGWLDSARFDYVQEG